MKESFRKIAHTVSNAAGHPWAFILAVLLIVVWALSGSFFDYSDTWQLIINSTTTVATFLMVFIIQNTQNRDAKAMQLKLDELIRATRARDTFIDIEDLSDEDLGYVTNEFRKIHEQSGNPALKKFHKQLESAHHHRSHKSNPSLANQVSDILHKKI